MRRQFYFLLLLSFFSCSAEKQEKTTTASASTQGRPGAERLFRNTELQLEATLLKGAGDLLRRGGFLEANLAERCWRNETARPLLREGCLLLWASGGEESPMLEEALLAGASSSRPLAAAAIMRRTPLEKLAASRLLDLLELLKKDPLWMRALAAEIWSRTNGGAERFLLERMLPLLLPPENGSAKDTAASLRALFFLSPGHWQAGLGKYCNSAVKGFSRSRCWRLVGALADPSLPASLTTELKIFLPVRGDRDWALFSRHFPALAARILHLFPLESR